MKLPDEDSVRRQIGRAHAQDFERAGRVLDWCTGSLANLDIPQFPPGMDPLSVALSLGLFVKSCKQTRAVLALAAIGLPSDAESVVRMQFETMVASVFILRPRILLRLGTRRVAPVRGVTFNSAFRAKLYIAHAYGQDRKMYEEMRRTPGIKRVIKKRYLDDFYQQADECRQEIGLVWADRIRNGGTYAGMPLRDLAVNLGFGGLYATLYRHTSATVHATDALAHIDADGANTIHVAVGPTDEGIGFSIGLTCLFLMRTFTAFGARFNLTLPPEAHGWLDEGQALIAGDEED